MPKPRKIAIIVGSTSDFVQCTEAVGVLKKAEQDGTIEIITPSSADKIIAASIHRHKPYLLYDLILPFLIKQDVDAIVCGAGLAAHLPGMVDSHLRYDLRNDTISIIGVAFDDSKNEEHTLAAILSISKVPGTQVIFDEDTHVGADGMTHACSIAINGDLPKITLPDPDTKPHGTFTWEEMLDIATAKK